MSPDYPTPAGPCDPQISQAILDELNLSSETNGGLAPTTDISEDDLFAFSAVNITDVQLRAIVFPYLRRKFIKLVASTENFNPVDPPDTPYNEAINALLEFSTFCQQAHVSFDVVRFLDKWIDFLVSTKERKELLIADQINLGLGSFCSEWNINFKPSIVLKSMNCLRWSCKNLWWAGLIHYEAARLEEEISAEEFIEF